MAPEVISNEPYTKTVDHWNYGCLVFELLAGQNPFAGEPDISALYQKITTGAFVIPSYFSPEAADLVSRLLETSPSKRLGSKSICEIKDHPFFHSIDWVALLREQRRGPLSAKFDREEHRLRALNLKLFDEEADTKRDLHLKGFSYNGDASPFCNETSL